MSQDIDLSLDYENELRFKVAVEGTSPGEASCRLLVKGSGMSYLFPGKFTADGEVSVTIPPLEKVIKEGRYSTSLEVMVDDRVFVPLSLEANFEKSVRVTAEAVARPKARTQSSAKAELISDHAVKKAVVNVQTEEVKSPVRYSRIQKDTNIQSPSQEDEKTVSVSDLSETQLRELVKKIFSDNVRKR